MKKTCDKCGCETDACVNCGNTFRKEIEMIGGGGSLAVYHCKDGFGCLREDVSANSISPKPIRTLNIRVVFTGGPHAGEVMPIEYATITEDDEFTIEWGQAKQLWP